MSSDLEISRLTEILDDIRRDRAQLARECTRIDALVTGTIRLLSDDGGSMLRNLHGSPERATAHLIQSLHEFETSMTRGYDNVEMKVRAVIDALRKQ